MADQGGGAMTEREKRLVEALAHVTGRAASTTLHYWPKVCEQCGAAEQLINASLEEEEEGKDG